MTINAQGKIEKRPEKILNLHFSTETDYDNKNPETITEKQQTLEKVEGLIFRLTTLLDSNA